MKRFIDFLNEADVPANTTGVETSTDKPVVKNNKANLYVRRNTSDSEKLSKYVKKIIKKGE